VCRCDERYAGAPRRWPSSCYCLECCVKLTR
jgi:hypothetical protein